MQQTHHEVQIDATPEKCMAIAIDFESYPKWAEDIKEVETLKRDPDGKGSLVSYRAAAIGRSITYTLEYFYGENPLRCAWQLKEGEFLRLLSGSYKFEQLVEDPKKTLVIYELAVDLSILLPSFVKRRLETRLIHTAIEDFRNQVETHS